jgi:hypothetical protein
MSRVTAGDRNPAGKLAGDAAICAECLVRCREIQSERLA